jgi:osmoprotectant transport system permease protein
VTDLAALTLAHLRLVLTALAAAIVIGGALGLVSLRRPAVERIALGAASLVQAIPAIALLAAMVPLLALASRASGATLSSIGELPAWIALTLYALLPIARGVVLGVRGIDGAVTQAALAVGMTARERLRIVELPLAAPSILSGLRTAAVWTVGMATLGTPVGASSLGNLIFGGLQTRNYAAVGVGCVTAAAMALLLDAVLALSERRARGRHGSTTLATTLIALLGAGVVAFGIGVIEQRRAHVVRIGAKSFTEQLVLAELLRCAVSDGIAVEVRPSLGTTVAFDALRAGDLDVYVEYTGTAWTTILRRADRAPRDAVATTVARSLAADHGVEVVASLGFENAYALVVRGDERARSIADLGTARDRVFGGDYEFFSRPEWTALRDAYGLAPREVRPMDPSLMYEALATKAVDVIAGYTTEGRIDAMHLRVLEDPKNAIPPYDAIVVVSERLAREEPAVVERLRALKGTVDPGTMRRWNAAVDAGKAARDVVREHPACRR